MNYVVNDRFMLLYQIANQPMEGGREWTRNPNKRWMGHSGSIYVLTRDDSEQE